MTQRTKVSVCISLEFLVVLCALRCYRRVRRGLTAVSKLLRSSAVIHHLIFRQCPCKMAALLLCRLCNLMVPAIRY